MANVSLELPNPLTPMAFFPPNLAFQITVSTYVLVGSTSVLIWDILMNLQRDLRMLMRNRITMPLIVYVISRLSALVYLLGITIIQTAPVSHCENSHLMQSLYPIVIPSTSLLFFFRIKAMYDRNKKIIAFFFFMWLTVVAGSITPAIGVSAMNIGITDYCINYRLEPYVSTACIIPFINDTFIFCATSWRLWQNAHVQQSIHNNVKVMVFGHHLPYFSRTILKDGQAYYLTTITLNLVTAALFFNTSIPVVYRSFIGVPNIVLMNSMACHVYRNVRLGVYIHSGSIDDSISTAVRHGRKPHSAIVFDGGNRGMGLSTSDSRQPTSLDMELDRISKKSMEKSYDSPTSPLSMKP